MLFFNSVVDVIVMRARAEDRTQRHPLGAPQYAPLFGAALGFTVVSQVKSINSAHSRPHTGPFGVYE